MLLRIDVYPSKFQVSGFQQPLPPSPTPPFHACLSSAKSSKSGDDKKGGAAYSSSLAGILIIAGRSDQGDICILNDKSVSREHLILRLISKHAQHQKDIWNNDDDTGDAVDPSHSTPAARLLAKGAMAPRNAEEQAACDQSEDGMCVVVENLGKFGSLVAIPKQPPENDNDNKKKNEDDDDTGNDDETDDENDDKKASVKTESQVAEVIIQPRKHELDWKRLGVNESAILYDLSTTPATTKSSTAPITAIEIGQNGATLVITKVRWNMAWSGVPPAIMKLWNDRLYTFGATRLDDSNNDNDNNNNDAGWSNMTHLISTDGKPSAKLLTAWCRNTPIVSIGFLQAMMQRQSPKDPLPNPQDYVPTAVKERTWWKQQYQSGKPPNAKLWAAYTILCASRCKLGLDELARAAGANVIPLYDMAVAEALKTTNDVVKQQPEGYCFGMNPGAPKTKLCQLWKRLKLQILTAKDVANKITEQQPLTEDGGALQNVTTDSKETAKLDGAAKPSTTTQKPPTSQKASPSASNSNKEEEDIEKKEDDAKPTSRSTRSTPNRGTTKTATINMPAKTKSDKQDDVDEAHDDPPTASQQQRASRSGAANKSHATPKNTSTTTAASKSTAADAIPVATTTTTRSTRLTETPAKSDSPFYDDHNDAPMDTTESPVAASQKAKNLLTTSSNTDKDAEKLTGSAKPDAIQVVASTKKGKANEGGRDLKTITEEPKPIRERRYDDKKDNDDNIQRQDDHEIEKERKAATKKQKVEAPPQGWFVAQGSNERQAFRRSFEETDDDAGLPIATAVTEARADLIVIRQPITDAALQQASTSASHSIPNFKRFRKNLVMTRGSQSLIQLQSVLPKETPRLRELEEQQLMLEEVQRAADALFHDGTVTAIKKTKARESSNSILSYMKKKPTTAKRGRSKAIDVDNDDDDLDI